MDSDDGGDFSSDKNERSQDDKDGMDKETPEASPQSAASPSASPRGKQQRLTGPQQGASSPQTVQRPNTANFMVSASPPKFVSMEEIMKAADGVTNMTLAHEIAVDNDFRFKKRETPSESLEQRVREVMHNAFWDALRDKLREDPPDYSSALVLLQEVKQALLDLMLPQHQTFVTQINEVLDMDLIEQKADHGALDIHYYASFVISIMAKMCAPVRDEQIAKLSEHKEVVPLFKAIFEVLDLMKVDMANFAIQQIRPFIQQQSVDYEKKKFQDLLKQQQDLGLDGLEFTRAWLSRAAQDLPPVEATSPSSTLPSPTAQSAGATAPSGPTAGYLSPAAILNTAYLALLHWPENLGFPETVLMDRDRFFDLEEKFSWLVLVSSVILVTYNTVGAAIAGISEFKKKLKENLTVLLDGVQPSKVPELMPNVSEQVNKDVSECLRQHGFSQLSEERTSLLKGQVSNVADVENPVHKIMQKRLMTSMLSLLARPGGRELLVPQGFSAVAEELSHVYGQFLRLVSHNRAVFGVYYADIIGKIVKDAERGAAESTTTEAAAGGQL